MPRTVKKRPLSLRRLHALREACIDSGVHGIGPQGPRSRHGLTALARTADVWAYGLIQPSIEIAYLGQALGRAGGSYQCVGVAPIGRTTWPGSGHECFDRDRAALEAHHTHFVMVDGSDWGDETPAMLEVTGLLAGSEPFVGVLAGGGEIAAEEVHGHLLARRPVIVLAGSGRLADRVVEALGRGTPVPLGTDEEEHRELLEVVEL